MVMVYAFGRDLRRATSTRPSQSAPRSAAGWRGSRSACTSSPSSPARSSARLCLFVLIQGFAGFEAEGNMGQNSFGDDGSGYAWWAAFLLEMRADRGLRDRHPRGHRRAQRAPRAWRRWRSASPWPRSTSSRSPRPAPRSTRSGRSARRCSPAATRSRSCGCSSSRRCSAPRSPDSPTRCCSAAAATPVPGSGLSFSRPRTAAVPGYAAPDQYQQQWNQQRPPGPAAWQQQPIVQDGWQWDPVGQQWHPVRSHAGAVAGASRPPAGPAGTGSRGPAEAAGAAMPQQRTPPQPTPPRLSSRREPTRATDGTQIRPPQ